MPEYGLVGLSLQHSFSKKYFTGKFSRPGLKDHIYTDFELPHIGELPALINKHRDLKGFNVTIPYKVSVMQYLDKLDVIAKEVGAVNTVKIINSGEKRILKGYNTDVFGFGESLKPLLRNEYKSALILGSGGASKAVAYVLKRNGIEFNFVSRGNSPGMLQYHELNKRIMNRNLIIINTTPLGSFPGIDEFPAIPYQYITGRHLCYDLVYNPAETLFLQQSKEKGALIKNGSEMLHLQAEGSWIIWNEEN